MTPELIANIKAMITKRIIISDDEPRWKIDAANYELGYLDAILRCTVASDKTAEAIWPCLVTGFTNE